MANTVRNLGKGQITATTAGTAEVIATTPTTYDYSIDYIMVFNTHSSAVTIYLYQVNDNAGSVGTLAATDQFFQYALAAYETLLLGRNDIMLIMTDTNDTLKAYASITAKLNYWVYGMKLADQM